MGRVKRAPASSRAHSSTPTTRRTSTRRKTLKATASLPDLALAVGRVIQHEHADTTIEGYERYVRQFQGWAVDVCEGQMQGAVREALEKGLEAEAGAADAMDAAALMSDLLTLLEDPKESAPFLIRLHITQLCEVEGSRAATGWGSYSALKHHFRNLGGQGRYHGRWERRDGKWVGNPCNDTVLGLVHAIENRDKKEGFIRNHSLPMTWELLQRFVAWCDSRAPDLASLGPEDMEGHASYALASMLKTVGSLAWTIFARISEVAKLQVADIIRDIEDGPPFHLKHMSVFLRDRKGFTRHANRGGRAAASDELEGMSAEHRHEFKLYENSEEDVAEAYQHLRNWLDYLELRLGRPLQAHDHVFPTISKKGALDPSKGMTEDFIIKQLDLWAAQDEHVVKLRGRFTTHCFRRGGAQYRFMFAPIGRRWTLRRIRWWGGWAEKEHHDTIIKYLLDELENYTEGCSDSLHPFRDGRDVSFMGEHRALPNPEPASMTPAAVGALVRSLFDKISNMDLQVKGLEKLLSDMVQDGRVTASQFAAARMTGIQRGISHVASTSQRTAANVSTSTTTQGVLGPSGSAPQPATTHDHTDYGISTPAQLMIPGPPHSVESPWEWIVDDWDKPDLARGLLKALQTWTEEEIRMEHSLQVKYGQRRLVALTFIEDFKRNKQDFEAAYPESRLTLKALLGALQHRSPRVTRRPGRRRTK